MEKTQTSQNGVPIPDHLMTTNNVTDMMEPMTEWVKPEVKKTEKQIEDEARWPRKLPDFETIELTQLDAMIKTAHDQEKYLFIADQSGKAVTFFQYQAGGLIQVHSKAKQHVIFKKQTKEDVSEAIRKDLVLAMKYGYQSVWNLDQMVPKMKEDYDNFDILPLDGFIFHRKTLLSEYL